MKIQEITDVSVLTLLSKCNLKITIYDLFGIISSNGVEADGAVDFVKTINDLHSKSLIEISQDSESVIYWSITESGKKHLEGPFD